MTKPHNPADIYVPFPWAALALLLLGVLTLSALIVGMDAIL